MGSSQTRARTPVPCIGRQILNHCATREALFLFFFVLIYHHCFLSTPFSSLSILFSTWSKESGNQLFSLPSTPGVLHHAVSVWSDLLHFLWIYHWITLKSSDRRLAFPTVFWSTLDVLPVSLLPWALSLWYSGRFLSLLLSLGIFLCSYHFHITIVGIPFAFPVLDLLVPGCHVFFFLGLLPHFSGVQHLVCHEKDFMGGSFWDLTCLEKMSLFCLHTFGFVWLLEIIFPQNLEGISSVCYCPVLNLRSLLLFCSTLFFFPLWTMCYGVSLFHWLG